MVLKNLPYGTLGPEGYWQYDISAVYDRAAVLYTAWDPAYDLHYNT